MEIEHQAGASVPGADLADLGGLALVMRLELVISGQLEVCEREAAVGAHVDGRCFAGLQVFHLHCRAGNDVV